MGTMTGDGGSAHHTGGRRWDGVQWVPDDPSDGGSADDIDPSGVVAVGGGLTAVVAVLVLATVACSPVSIDALVGESTLVVAGLLLLALPIYDAVHHWPARLYLGWTVFWFAGLASIDCSWYGTSDGDCVAFQAGRILIIWFLGGAALAICRLVSWTWGSADTPR